MRSFPPLLVHCSIVLVLVGMVCHPRIAAAELNVSLEVSESYEDNVIGLTADNPNIGATVRGGSGPATGGMNLKGGMGSVPGGSGGGGTAQRAGDFATSLYADFGWDRDLSDATGFTLLLGVEHKAYNSHSEFDFTIGTLSASVGHDFTDDVTGSFMASLSDKDFDGTLRDSTAYGVSVGLKERFTSGLWLRESVSAEQNSSRSAVYDYTGVSAGISAGYDISDSQTLSTAYSYLVRDFKESVPAFRLMSQVAGLYWSLELNDDWTVFAGYDHEWADSTVPNSATTNNIYHTGIRYDY